MYQFIQFVEIINHFAPIKLNYNLLVNCVNIQDSPTATVVDILLAPGGCKDNVWNLLKCLTSVFLRPLVFEPESHLYFL